MGLDDLARRLGLEDHRLLGEGIDALVFLRSGFGGDVQFHQARDDQLAVRWRAAPPPER